MAAPPAKARTDDDYLIKLFLIGDSVMGMGDRIWLLWKFDNHTKLNNSSAHYRNQQYAYYRGAMGILLVYDVTDEPSFNNIRNCIRNIEQLASDNVNKILVGNKADMEESKRSLLLIMSTRYWLGTRLTWMKARGLFLPPKAKH